jgi:CheY-like chemotaxis protein
MVDPALLDGATILLIDDSAENRLLLTSQLGMQGYRCCKPKTGQRALPSRGGSSPTSSYWT